MALSGALQRRIKATKKDEELSELEDDFSENEFSENTGNTQETELHGNDSEDARDNQGVSVKSVDHIPHLTYNIKEDYHNGSDEVAEDDYDTSRNNQDIQEHSGLEPGSSNSIDPQQALSSVSFGALVSAQRSLGLKRKRRTSKQQEGLRIRQSSPFQEAEERRAGKKIKHPTTTSRPSKDAPMELSSKKAVSRKRQVVSMSKLQPRDPRFSSLSGILDVNHVNQKYAFLNEYRASEIGNLKQQIRNTKDLAAKAASKRELKSMEDQERTRRRAEEEKAVVREHRKGEREKVKQGKKPFFLKKGEVKKQALVKRFERMGEKKAEKVMEKKRKKKAGKEKKAMPRIRRRED